LTHDAGYHDKAEQTMEVFAGIAGRYGIFAATYGLAAIQFSQPHTQVIILGDGDSADRLHSLATSSFSLTKSVIKLSTNEAVPANLPSALAEVIPNFPALKPGESIALVCSGFTCQPPVRDAENLKRILQEIEQKVSKL
jgi:uncharacterized protein YyaL (SSP411 family)